MFIENPPGWQKSIYLHSIPYFYTFDNRKRLAVICRTGYNGRKDWNRRKI
jgi:hypothetical protein